MNLVLAAAVVGLVIVLLSAIPAVRAGRRLKTELRTLQAALREEPRLDS